MKKRTKRICSVLLIVALCIAGLPWAAVHGEFEVPQAETENAVLPTETEESTVQAEAADDNNALQTGLSEDTAQEGNGGAVSADEAVADTAEAFDAEDVDYIETYEQENPTAEQEEESDGGKASATEAEEAAGTKTDEAATVATDGTAVTEVDETAAADSSEAVTAESDDVTEVQQEQQEWLPAKTLDMETEDGIGVTIAFDDNVFPAGTTVRLDDIPRDEAMENLSGAVDGIIVDAVGVDISFHNDAGEEVQPAGDVNVSLILKTPLLDGDEQTVVHIGHDGTATELSSSDVQEVSVDGAEFVASSFSEYYDVSLLAEASVSDSSWLSDYNYKKGSGSTIILTEYKGGGGDLTIPSLVEIDGESYSVELSTASDTQGIWSGSSVTGLSFDSKVGFPNDLQNFFNGMTSLYTLDLSNIDTTNVTNMSGMFSGCSSLNNLSLGNDFDTSSVTNMSSMFSGCRSLTSLDLSGFKTSKVKTMQSMFSGCSSLMSLDVSGFDTSDVTDMRWMFRSCSSLTSLDVSGFDTSDVTEMSYMFSGCNGLTTLTLGTDKFITNKVTNMSSMFSGCSGLPSLDVSGFTTGKVTNMSSMFSGCSGLTSLDMSSFATDNVTNMSSMFSGCSGLTSLGLSSFDTDNVTNMSGMFSGCSGLTSLDVSSFDTGNVTNMSSMFSDCSDLTGLNLNNFDTSQVTDMGEMFSGCSGLKETLDISNFNTSNVIDMVGMFSGCSQLKGLKWEWGDDKFNTSQVTDMTRMFKGCENLTDLDVSKFNTSAVGDSRQVNDSVKTGNMSSMFNGCKALTTLDVSNFDTSKVTDMSEMFKDCNSLTTLTLFATENVQKISSMFVGCDKLEELNLSSFDLTNLSAGGEIFPDVILTEIKSPTNLKQTIPLPKVKYYDSSNGETAENATSYYKNLPKGELDSITLVPLTEKVNGVTLAPKEVEPEDFDPAEIEIDISSSNKSRDLVATVLPANAKDTSVEWSSSDPTVAAIIVSPDDDENGNVWNATVTALKVGETTITVTPNGETDGTIEPATCKVTVVASVTSVELDKEEIILDEEFDNTAELTATVLPSYATDTDVIWSSDDEDGVIIKIEEIETDVDNQRKVKVTAIGRGTATITVTTDGTIADSETEHCTDTCEITVEAAEHVTSVSLDKDEMELYTNQTPITETLTATVAPSNATNKNVSWTSSDESVVAVSGSGTNNLTGTVRALSAGTATITVTTEDGGKTVECEVTVKVAVTGVSLSPTLYLYKGEEETLTAEVAPSNATNQNVSWESSDESIVTVDENGKVTAVKAGTATITITTEDGAKTASCEVTVTGYSVEIVDNRSTPDAEHISAGVSSMRGDSYLVIADVDEESSQIIPLIEADSSLSPTTHYVCDMSLMSEKTGGSAVTNFGNCLIRMPLPDEMSLNSGSVQVVSVLSADDGTLSLDKSIRCYPVVLDGKEYLQFATTHFTEYAFLYTAPQAPSQPSSSGVVRSSGSSSSSGSVSVRRSSSSSSSSSVVEKASPKFTKVYWRADEKSTFYWKYAKKATGYRLEYSEDGKFKKTATQSVGRKKKNGTVKGLKVGKTYYVRVKAYKLVNGKKQWSAWSHRIVVKRKR